ncbi:MAG TPA: fibronectin type III domain-containing protein, partial [Chloroflexota bacterium]|nr:fibronectin type III domain-containing protein [Chloroflexota bacterium]
MGRWGNSLRFWAILLLAGSIGSGVLGYPPLLAASAGPVGSLAVGPQGDGARVAAQDASCDVQYGIDSPAEGAAVSGSLYPISGWAVDRAASEGTGIQGVAVGLDVAPDQGGVTVPINYGLDRPEVAEQLGDERFTPSGFQIEWDTRTAPSGPHPLFIVLQTACGPQVITRNVVVANPPDSTLASSVAAQAGGAAPPPSPTVASAPPTITPVPTATPSPALPPSPTPNAATLTAALATPTPPAAAAPAPGTPAAGTPAPTITPTPTPTSSLPPPSNVTIAVSPLRDAVSLSWTPPTAQVVIAYRIVTNEPDGRQLTLLEVPGNLTTAIVRGLDPRVGYSLSVVAIDAAGRPSAPSAPVTTAGAPTMTPLPTPTLAPWCTP